jgi:anti-sigma-K factor RskA
MNIRDPRFDEGNDPPDDDMLAAEYVLGVLDATERRQAQARIETDAEFARRVQTWEQHFAAMLYEIKPVEVPTHLWPYIRTQLGWSPVEGGKRRPWQDVNFWRVATSLATAAAVAAIFIALLPPRAPAPVPPPVVVQPVEPARAVTTLARDDGSPAWLASIDIARGIVQLVPVPAPADAQGRVTELWLIPPGEAPKSLGLISTDKTQSITVPKALLRALAKGSTLAVSLEPPGGAPQGTPTGPIIAKGGIEAI